MNLIGLSINHNTAPIELREALHLGSSEITELIPEMKKTLFTDGFIISTCNRTEVFGFPIDGSIDYKKIKEFLINNKKIEGLKAENFNIYFSCGAVRHIFRVATGLDSLVLGDSQILGQVKEAFQLSEDNNFTGTILRRIYDITLKVGKRVINETEIGEGAVTISYAAVQVIEKIFANLYSKSALVIGAGETGELAAIHLKDKGVQCITIANRTKSKAEKLAKKVDGNVIDFENIDDELPKYDIVVSATSAENLIIEEKTVKKVMKRRKGSPVCMMDIALPRDIDPKVTDIENVFYHDIDSLNIIVEENLKKRKKEIPAVEEIIMEEMVSFFSWYNTLDVVPTIKSFREFFEEIKQDELDKIKYKITDEDFEKVEDMTRRLIGRLLHNPTIKMRELAESGTNIQEMINYTMILKDLYKLDK